MHNSPRRARLWPASLLLLVCSCGSETPPSVDTGAASAPAAPPRGSLGDWVWEDRNYNGLQDTGEPGIDGVRVVLRNAAGDWLAEATTGLSSLGIHGFYRFTDLPLGGYQVCVDAASLPRDFVPTSCGVGSDRARDSEGAVAKVALTPAGRHQAAVDFGFGATHKGVVASHAWLDRNENGQRDYGESGVPELSLCLRDASGARVAVTTTGVDGHFAFHGVAAGRYRIAMNPEAPVGLAMPAEFARDVLVSKASLTPLVPGFSLRRSGRGVLIGSVFADRDGDAVRGADEVGLESMRVRLWNAASELVAVRFADRRGFRFEGLPAGRYRIEVDTGGLPPGSWRRTIAAASCELNTKARLDIGYHSEAAGLLGDRVWVDRNADGVCGGSEKGLAGVRVRLMDAARRVLAVRTTNRFGTYSFEQLPAGRYRVCLEPRSHRSSLRSVLSARAPRDGVAELLDGEQNYSLDFVMQPVQFRELGGRIWLDANADGERQSREAGIADVSVLLLDAQRRVLGRTHSDAQGAYWFAAVKPGPVSVEIDPGTAPAGLRSLGTLRARRVLARNAAPDTTVDFAFARSVVPREATGGVSSCQTWGSPAYWACVPRPAAWPIEATTSFATVFGERFPSCSIREIVTGAGGRDQALCREVAAAYLNAAARGGAVERRRAVLAQSLAAGLGRTPGERDALRMALAASHGGN